MRALLKVLDELMEFIELLESRALVVDGPIPTLIEELSTSVKEDQEKFLKLLKELYEWRKDYRQSGEAFRFMLKMAINEVPAFDDDGIVARLMGNALKAALEIGTGDLPEPIEASLPEPPVVSLNDYRANMSMSARGWTSLDAAATFLHRLRDGAIRPDVTIICYATTQEDGSIEHRYLAACDGPLQALGLIELVKDRIIQEGKE